MWQSDGPKLSRCRGRNIVNEASACMARNRFQLIAATITFDDVDTREERFVLFIKLIKLK